MAMNNLPFIPIHYVLSYVSGFRCIIKVFTWIFPAAYCNNIIICPCLGNSVLHKSVIFMAYFWKYFCNNYNWIALVDSISEKWIEMPKNILSRKYRSKCLLEKKVALSSRLLNNIIIIQNLCIHNNICAAYKSTNFCNDTVVIFLVTKSNTEISITTRKWLNKISVVSFICHETYFVINIVIALLV